MIKQCCRCIHAKSISLPHVDCDKCGNVEIDIKTDWSKKTCSFYDDVEVPYRVTCLTCNHSANIRIIGGKPTVFCMEKEESDHVDSGSCYLWELADCCKNPLNIYEALKPKRHLD